MPKCLSGFVNCWGPTNVMAVRNQVGAPASSAKQAEKLEAQESADNSLLWTNETNILNIDS